MLICCHGDIQTCLAIGARTSKPTVTGWNSIANSQVCQNPSKSTQDTLLPIKRALILDVLTNQADLDVHISLASRLSELIRITEPNPPFEDELMKKAFRIIVPSFRALPECADKVIPRKSSHTWTQDQS